MKRAAAALLFSFALLAPARADERALEAAHAELGSTELTFETARGGQHTIRLAASSSDRLRRRYVESMVTASPAAAPPESKGSFARAREFPSRVAPAALAETVRGYVGNGGKLDALDPTSFFGPMPPWAGKLRYRLTVARSGKPLETRIYGYLDETYRVASPDDADVVTFVELLIAEARAYEKETDEAEQVTEADATVRVTRDAAGRAVVSLDSSAGALAVRNEPFVKVLSALDGERVHVFLDAKREVAGVRGTWDGKSAPISGRPGGTPLVDSTDELVRSGVRIVGLEGDAWKVAARDRGGAIAIEGFVPVDRVNVAGARGADLAGATGRRARGIGVVLSRAR